MSRIVGRRFSFALLALSIAAAVAILAYFTSRTMLQLDRLRQQSVLESTLGLATEKAARLDRQIIDQDNAVIAVADPSDLDALYERWLPTARRETRTVRAVVILDEGASILAFASRAGSKWAEEEQFRRILVHRMVHDFDLGARPTDQLRHLHREYSAQSYLVSYWQRVSGSRTYLVVAWHDIGRVVKELLPALYGDTSLPASGRVNVVDEQGRIIFGPPLRSGEFTVGVRFPTTLYNWRLQVSPAAAEELVSRAQNRRLLEIGMVGLASVIVVAAAIAILLVADKERRISTLKSDFVANVSHELKTPLALVRMFAEMLASGRASSDEKRREYLDIIVRESERLTALIDNVLDFARLERGRDAYEMAVGDVGESVAKAVEIARYRAEREGVALGVTVETSLPDASIDDRAIQLAVSNLIDNALKYARDGKEIAVRVRRDGDWVRVEVEDRGPGVPEELRQRVFQRFIRGEHTARGPEAAPRGSGIGLALVRHVVESHRGKVWVEGADGGGARFCFTIPVARRRAP